MFQFLFIFLFNLFFFPSFSNPVSEFQLLEQSILSGDKRSFEFILPRVKNINTLNKKKQSLLHVIILKEAEKEFSLRGRKLNEYFITSLQRAGMNMNIRGAQDLTPLELALLRNDLKKAKFLLEKGANPNVKNLEGQNALYRVTIRDYQEKRKEAKKFARLNNRTYKGISPTDKHQYYQRAKLLLDNRAQTTFNHHFYFNYASWAVALESTKLLDLFIQSDRNNLLRADSKSGFFYTKNKKDILEKKAKGFNILHMLVLYSFKNKEKQLKMIERIGSLGRQYVNSKDSSRYTALSHAVSLGKVDIVDLLSRFQYTNFKILNYKGDSLVHLAMESMEKSSKTEYDQILKILKNKSVNMNLYNQAGSTALNAFLSNASEDKLTQERLVLFKELGMDFNLINKENKTAYQIIESRFKPQLTKFLQDYEVKNPSPPKKNPRVNTFTIERLRSRAVKGR